MAISNLRSCARWVAVFGVNSLLLLGAPPPAAADKGRSAPPGPAIEREPKVLTDEAEADGIAGKAATARAEICTLSVWTNVPRAEFVVDGHLVGMEPKREPIFVEVGEHTVMAKTARYTSGVTVMPCGKGDWVPVNLPLQPALKPGQVMSAPGPVQNAPILANVDREPLFKSSDFAAPGASAPRSTGNMLAIIAGGSMALAGTGFALGSFLAASSRSGKADDLESAISTQDPSKACQGVTPDFGCREVQTNRENATLFTALGVGTSVMAVGGIALTAYAIVDGIKKPGDPGVSMRVTPGFGSLAVTGRF